jgi:alpha-pyrone synthase
MNATQVKDGEMKATQAKYFLPIIEGIATGTPQHKIRQSDAARVVANLSSLEKNRDRIDKIYSNTQIETRHLAIDLLSEETIAFSQVKGNLKHRMELYQEYAIPLAERVSRKALESAAQNSDRNVFSDLDRIEDSIRLVVFVSSTGFIAPGVDTELIKSLGLRRDTARVTVNFMGCAAAMNGLRVACDHVRANPTHKALLVCLELSSINAVFNDEMNDVIIHSIFGDGCAAVVIGACRPQEIMGQGKIAIKDHLSYLVENTEDGITLGVEHNGITCKLSRQLPDYIEAGVGPIIEGFLTKNKLNKTGIDLWAVHPGGTKIIEKAKLSLGLNDTQVADSWAILRQYGNMLSPSVLFVLERMLLRHTQSSSTDRNQTIGLNGLNKNRNKFDEKEKGLNGIAFSFAPGIGVEGILFQKI